MKAATMALMFVFVAGAEQNGQVKLVRVLNGGIQPQVAVDASGVVHMIYFQGDPGHGDIFYVRSQDGGATFTQPVRVNSQPESAVATGTIRGAQFALGRNGRVHVAWNGSVTALPKGPKNPDAPADSPYSGTPMLYTRSNPDGSGFEPQRNLMQRTFGLDGGGSVAADALGNVYVAWHGHSGEGPRGEAGRRVWIARSADDGKTFASEAAADNPPAGACGCCGLRVFTDKDAKVYVLYRSATESVHRDIHLLVSKDHGRTFHGSLVQQWEINACPMSSMSFSAGNDGVLAAWETRGAVYYGAVDSNTFEIPRPIAAPGEAKGRKHPWVARNRRREALLVWTEGTGWQKGGSFAWQVYDAAGKPTSEKGSLAGIPVWSFAAAFARADGGFTVVY